MGHPLLFPSGANMVDEISVCDAAVAERCVGGGDAVTTNTLRATCEDRLIFYFDFDFYHSFALREW